MVSIKDVAKEAGVSVATVSRVINDSGTVTEATRKNVLDVIDRLGYKPNLFGKGVRRSGTKIIMVMLSSLANTFCSSVLCAIDKAAEKKGYYTVVCTTDGNEDKERYYINFACNGLFDGLIVLNSTLDKTGVEKLAERIPVVQCNEYVNTRVAPHVSIDNQRAAYDAVNMLIQNGRRKIVLFTADNNLVSTRERHKGYKKALADNGIRYDKELILRGNYGYRNAIRVFEDFLNTGKEFDGVFAISDRMAAGAVRVLLSSGYKVPYDAEVIGFDNTDISYTTTPQLSTVSQPHTLLGKNAFELMEKLFENKTAESIVVPHKIIERSSTKQR